MVYKAPTYTYESIIQKRMRERQQRQSMVTRARTAIETGTPQAVAVAQSENRSAGAKNKPTQAEQWNNDLMTRLFSKKKTKKGGSFIKKGLDAAGGAIKDAAGAAAGAISDIPGAKKAAKPIGKAAYKAFDASQEYVGDPLVGLLSSDYGDLEKKEDGSLGRNFSLGSVFSGGPVRAVNDTLRNYSGGNVGFLSETDRERRDKEAVLKGEEPGGVGIFDAITGVYGDAKDNADYYYNSNLPQGVKTATAIASDPLLYLGPGAIKTLARKLPEGVLRAGLLSKAAKAGAPGAERELGAFGATVANLIEGPGKKGTAGLLVGAGAGSQLAASTDILPGGELTEQIIGGLGGGIVGLTAAVKAGKAGARFKGMVDEFARREANEGGLANAAIADAADSFSGRTPVNERSSLRPSVKGRRKAGDNNLGGLPAGVRTQSQVNRVVDYAKEAAIEGQESKFWYKESGESFLEAAGGDVERAEQIARVAAVYSNNAAPPSELPIFQRALDDLLEGRQIDQGLEAPDKGAQIALYGSEEEWQDYIVRLMNSGQNVKTSNFYLAFMKFIDPVKAAKIAEAGGGRMSVNDLWMNRLFFGPDAGSSITAKQHVFMSESITAIADELGWNIDEVQAAMWVAARSRAGDSLADVDFRMALNRNMGQISVESVPGLHTPRGALLKGIYDLPPETQMAFHAESMQAFEDDLGGDMSLKLFDVWAGNRVDGSAVWDGNVHPMGSQVGVVASSAKGDGAASGRVRAAVSGEAFDGDTPDFMPTGIRARIDAAAAMKGLVLEQDAMAWTRPFYTTSDWRQNGVAFNLGRTITEIEMTGLMGRMQDGLGKGVDVGDNFAFLPTEEGVMVFKLPGDADFAAKAVGAAEKTTKISEGALYYGEEISPAKGKKPARVIDSLATQNKRVRNAILEATEAAIEQDFDYRAFASDGNFFFGGADGKGYRQRFSAFESPDVRKVELQLRERLDSIANRYARRYKLGPWADGADTGTDAAGVLASRSPGEVILQAYAPKAPLQILGRTLAMGTYGAMTEDDRANGFLMGAIMGAGPSGAIDPRLIRHAHTLLDGDLPLAQAVESAVKTGEDAGYRYAMPTRHVREIMGDIKPTDSKVAEAILGGVIDPSLKAHREVNQAALAWVRKGIDDEAMTNVAVQSAVTSHNPAGFRGARAFGPGGSVFDLRDDGAIVDNVTRIKSSIGADGASAKLTPINGKAWQDVYSRPQDYALSDSQLSAIEDFHAPITDMNRMRQANGIPALDIVDSNGSIYTPRQVKGSGLKEFTRPSRSNLQRVHEFATEGIESGVRYSDSPEETLRLYLKQGYREISLKQLSDTLEPLSLPPRALIPAAVRQEVADATQALRKVQEEIRGERGAVMSARTAAGRSLRSQRNRVARVRSKLAREEGTGRERADQAGQRENVAQADAARGSSRTDVARQEKKVSSIRTQLARVEGAGGARDKLRGTGGGAQPRQAITSTAKRIQDLRMRLAKESVLLQELKAAGRDITVPATSARAASVRINRLRGVGSETQKGLEAELQALRDMEKAAQQIPRVRTPRGPALGDKLNAKHDAAKARLRAAKSKRAREMEAVRSKEFSEAKIFGEGDGKPIRVKQWRNRFFAQVDAEKLEDLVGPALGSGAPVRGGNWVTGMFERIGNTTRFLSAALDLGAPFIQGIPTLGRNPKLWAKATMVHYKAAFDPNLQARYIRDNLDDFAEMAKAGVPIGDVEVFNAVRAGGTVRSVGEKALDIMPKTISDGAAGTARHTFGRMQAAYETYLTVQRHQLWKGLSSSVPDGVERAQLIRNMTGGLSSKALGVGMAQRQMESTWLAFSPRLLRSTISLVAQAANPRTAGGRDALRGLVQLAAGATGIYVATGLALGKDWGDITEGLNPLNGKQFLSHEVNGQWIGIGGQIRALTQFAAAMANAVVNEQGNLITLDSRDNPFISFAASRGSVGVNIAGAILDGTTGSNILRYEDIDNPIDALTHIGGSALPFAMQGIIEGDNAMGIAAGFLGSRTSPSTPTDQLNAISEARYGKKSFWDLEPAQRRAIKTEYPDVWRLSVTRGSDDRQEAEQVRVELEDQQVSSDISVMDGSITREQWRENYYGRRDEMSARLNQIYGNRDPNEKPKTPLDAYFQIIRQSEGPDGNVDWDAVDSWTSSQTDEDQAFINRNTGLGGTALVQTFKSMQEKYYDLPVYRGYSPDEARDIDALWQEVRNRSRSADEVEMNRSLKRLVAALGEVDPKVVKGVRKRILGALPRLSVRARFLAKNPAFSFVTGRGTLTPAEMEAISSQIPA